MLKRLRLPLILVLIALCAYAKKTPVGHVASTAPFDLNGATVKVDGVPSWPVYPGDVIVTHATPLTIIFLDGSRIQLAENSKIMIETREKRTIARLLSGSGKYIVAGSVAALSTAVALVLTDTVGGSGATTPVTTSSSTTLSNPSPIK